MSLSLVLSGIACSKTTQDWTLTETPDPSEAHGERYLWSWERCSSSQDNDDALSVQCVDSQERPVFLNIRRLSIDKEDFAKIVKQTLMKLVQSGEMEVATPVAEEFEEIEGSAAYRFDFRMQGKVGIGHVVTVHQEQPLTDVYIVCLDFTRQDACALMLADLERENFELSSNMGVRKGQ